jgi:hypothetical protein
MDVLIQLNGENKGTIPYDSLPLHRLWYEQAGFIAEWNHDKQTLNLTPSWKNKKVCFFSNKQDRWTPMIIEKTKEFLRDTEIELISHHSASSSEKGDILLRIHVHTNLSSSQPRYRIIHSSFRKGKSLATALLLELRSQGWSVQIKKEHKSWIHRSLVELHCYLPKENQTDQQTWLNNLSFSLATVILKKLTKGLITPLLLQLPTAIHPSSIIEKPDAKPIQPMKPSAPPQVEKTSVQAIAEPKESNTLPAPTPSAPPKLGMPDFKAEVFFDYRLFVPNSDDESYLVHADLHIKNTGLHPIINPVVCLRMDPTDKIQLKGQILPPQMVDTVGVQSSTGDGAIGWQYLDNDWFQQAKERGEYWVRPVRPLILLPNKTESFSHFHLLIPKPETSKSVTIQAVVYQKDLNLQFPANNQIVLSF